MIPRPKPKPAPLPTDSTACRADRHELCSAPNACPCSCHSEPHVAEEAAR